MTDFPETLLHQLHHCVNLLHRNGRGCRQGGGMHHRGQGRILALLAENDGLSQKDLADRFRIRPASLSELLDKLERSGIVERRQNEEDRRSSHVFLTEEGRKSALESAERHHDRASTLFVTFSQEEQSQLSSLLTKLMDRLETVVAEEDDAHHGRCCHQRGEKDHPEHHECGHRHHHDGERPHRHAHGGRRRRDTVQTDESNSSL